MDPLIMVGVLIALMVGFMVFGGSKQKRMMQQRYDMLGALLPGDRVVTTAGLYATVVKVHDTEIDLMIADGIITTWDQSSIRSKVEDDHSEEEAQMEQSALADDELDATIIPDTLEGLDDGPSATDTDTTNGDSEK